MGMGDITRDAVLRAVAECDALGRTGFLLKYRFGEARRYLLRYEGRLYDSKAVVGAAHGHVPGRTALTARDFSGGARHAVATLRNLGFEVVDGPGPDDDQDGEDREATEAPPAEGEAVDPRLLSEAARYQAWCRDLDAWAAENAGRRRTEPAAPGHVRSAAARRAVLLRCGGRCENPECPGQPADVTDAGDPILEVDHVTELARGGPDHPSQMVALCPNCHAVKTRGRTREQLRTVLRDVVRDAHARWTYPAS